MCKLYIYGSVHRWSIIITVQRDATQSSLLIILQAHSTCFGCQPHPSWVHNTVNTASGIGQPHSSSGVHKTVSTAFGIGHIFCSATSLQSGQASLATLEEGAQKIRAIPKAIVTVLCTPVDGCGWHPKHVEWTCRIIYRPLCVASRWTIINKDM